MRMSERAQGAQSFLPKERDLPNLSRAAAGCRGCSLYRRATQTVFGEGAPDASVVFVGEQPGDQEDRQGHPFVGPAGRLLASAMDEAGIGTEATYITNAVKHFKWELRGKRRIHKRPSQVEISACRPWLEAEVQAVRPQVLVCLGVTAASSVFERRIRISDYRERIVASPLAEHTLVTAHPAAIVRVPEQKKRRQEFSRLVRELSRAAGRI
jgi:uracil-DNA glycosylase family protein